MNWRTSEVFKRAEKGKQTHWLPCPHRLEKGGKGTKGPPPEEVYSEWEVGMILEEAGLRIGRVVEVGPYAYGFYAMFVKQ
jgi:hypothetical protein